jgi:hypothetical protein
MVVPRKHDQPIPTAARPASAAGRTGATAVTASPPAMIAVARANARGPGMPRAARTSVPARLPAARAVSAAPSWAGPPAKDWRTRAGTDTCMVNASVAINARVSSGARSSDVCAT